MIRRRAALGALLFAPALAFAGSAGQRIWVVSNGWHSGIVLARADVPESVIPEIADFPQARFFEFGWGDAEFYPAREAGAWLALRAAFPGPAVMHVAGLPDHPARIWPNVTILPFAVDADALRRLLDFLRRSFDRAGAGRAVVTARGIYPFSLFYPATGRFHVFNNCNTWTAQALTAMGLGASLGGVNTADDLISRIRPFAAVE
ncbi:MAG: DUF2459 domain-containing protein [Roseomonas sp.]|nr:DUF2459 domain-containing protein [Roseomonas sp.]MCA3391248.1 DUF2459 domain-containing protein [Roseomonas sp.]MCA3408228.1 DUF2459 domain-containing protein [Roseomonas sp.]